MFHLFNLHLTGRAAVTQCSVGRLCPLTPCPAWWYLNDIQKSFSQQTARDSKRRASKEGGALSKDGQPVSIGGSGDAEPVECVWCKTKTRRASVRRKVAGAASSSPWDRMVIYRKCVDDVCEGPVAGFLSVDLSGIQHKRLHMSSIQRSRDAASLLCHCKCMCEAENGSQTVFMPSTMLFLRTLMVPVRGLCHCVQASVEKEKRRPSHMHMIITICTSNVFCVGLSQWACFSSVCKYIPFVENEKR